MSLRLRVTSLLAKTEAVYGTDPIASGAANAVLLKGEPTLTPMELTSVERDLMRPYFGNAESLPSSIFTKIDFEVEAAGSGTPGVAPAWGPLLRGAGFSETILAANLTGSAQVGGSTSTIKLAANSSPINDLYNGMPISITAGVGNGQSGLIVDYDGLTKIATVASANWVAPDNTSAYTIGASATYKRITDNPESIAIYMNLDGVLHKMLGARGSVSSGIEVDKMPSFKFSFKGLFVPVQDATTPNVVLSNWKQGVIANKLNTPFAMLHSYQGALESFDFDMGNEISFHSLINANEQMLLTDSKPSGNITIEATAVAQKDWWTTAKNATLGTFAIQHGTVAGNKLGLVLPATQIANPTYGNKNGVAMMKAKLLPLPVSGNDELTISAF